MKKCTKCGVERELKSFGMDKSKKSGVRSQCKICRNEYLKEYRKRPEVREYRKKYQIEKREKIASGKKQYYQDNKIYLTSYRKKYQVEYKKKYNQRLRERRKTEIHFKITGTLRNRINHAIKNNQRRGSAIKDLGCSVDELKLHLENQFKEGMTWENHSISGWHIDHILPLDSFDLTNREQFLKACHYTNLQPLWAGENIRKGNKIIPSTIV